MDVKSNPEGTFIEIDGKVRIEQGRVRKTAKATEELLSNENTAGHYQVGAFDAVGKKIELGKPMSYIDFKSNQRVWNVYQLVGTKKVKMIEGPKQGEMIEIPNWQPIKDSVCANKDEAMVKAMEIAMART